MGPDKPLPYLDDFSNAEGYVDSLLEFVGTSELLRTLCGGVHILDFFTSTPDLYSRILPQDWREFSQQHEIMNILDLLMREDLEQFLSPNSDPTMWRDGPCPPQTLLHYIAAVRKHLLFREPSTSQCNRNRAMEPTQKLARQVAVGMNVKKVHEVGLFASYTNTLTTELNSSGGQSISHLVDFGSGQNYLGRALASQPYNKHIVAIESKEHNIEGAKSFDVMAKLAQKEKIMRNKKAFRAGLDQPRAPQELPTPPPEPALAGSDGISAKDGKLETQEMRSARGLGSIQYIGHRIQDGNLENVIDQIEEPAIRPNSISALDRFSSGCTTESDARVSNTHLMVISLHSCGNLVHHGLRSLILNPAVKAVAMVGCCYNLVTERLTPATYKLPELRPQAHPRLHDTGTACDPHGFPMSNRLCNDAGEGLHLNITARMMAVQAPQNWGEQDSEGFFTRHFYRALLQSVFLDRGVVSAPSEECVGGSPLGHSSGTPIIIGSLRKGCYASFVTYFHGALAKLYEDPERGQYFKEKMRDITDAEIARYEELYRERKKELSVIWSLMAFSAGVVEAVIVVDRWLWLREQEEVKEAWVEPVFDYRMSPRNLVVVGIKK